LFLVDELARTVPGTSTGICQGNDYKKLNCLWNHTNAYAVHVATMQQALDRKEEP